MKVLQLEPKTSLKYALRSNAVFSTLSGIAFLFAPAYFATLVGIGQSGFTFLGVNLLGFALLLIGLSSAWSLNRKWMWLLAGLVVLMDILWVVGSIFLSLIPSMATDLGKGVVLSISVIVGTFAIWQLIALIGTARNKSTPANNSASTTMMIAFIMLPLLSGCAPADLRTAPLKHSPVDQELIDKGRQLMHNTALAHGLTSWQTYETQEITLTDAWQAPSWWPADEQALSFKSMLGTFTARATFLDGPQEGSQWGTQSWQSYQRDDTGKLDMLPDSEELDAYNFYIPSLHYFHELPFRMLHAENIAYAGEKTYQDKTYDLVFITWGGFDLNAHHDQYILWINQQTSLIEMCRYTIRQAGSPFTGTIHFEDYQDVQGVQFPFKHTVVLPSPENTIYPLDKYFFHQSRISNVVFDSFDKSELIVDASLVPADDKP